MSPISSPDIVLFNERPEQSKAAQYLIYQPYTLQVIQLVEGPPPPRRTALLESRTSSFASSSCSSDDEESVASSYCSSDEDNLEHPETMDSPSLGQTTGFSTPGSSEPASHNFRMQRILAWRKDFSSSVATTTSSSLHSAPADSHGSSSSSLKRRMNDEEHSNGSVGSKRARSHGQFGPNNSVEHTCAACDLRFPTLQSLRQHGNHDAVATEACFIAVQYAFEETDDCERR